MTLSNDEVASFDKPLEIQVGQVLSSEREAVVELLTNSFLDDPGNRYVFRSLDEARRWLPAIYRSSFDMAESLGFVTGAWKVSSEHSSPVLVGVALWSLGISGNLPANKAYPIFGRWLCFFCSRFLAAVRWTLVSHRFYRCLPRKESFWILCGLAISPSYRGIGIGTCLVNTGITRLTTSNRRLLLGCWRPRVSFYQRLGFEILHESRMKGIVDSACLMARNGCQPIQLQTDEAKLSIRFREHAEQQTTGRGSLVARTILYGIITALALVTFVDIGIPGVGMVMGGYAGGLIAYHKRPTWTWIALGFGLGAVIGAIVGFLVEVFVEF